MPGPFVMLLKAQEEEKQEAAKTAAAAFVKKLATQIEATGTWTRRAKGRVLSLRCTDCRRRLSPQTARSSLASS